MGSTVCVSGAIRLGANDPPRQPDHAVAAGVAGGGRVLRIGHGRARGWSHSAELEAARRLVAVGRPAVAGAELQANNGGGGARPRRRSSKHS